MDNKPLISIVIASFERPKLLKQTFKSLAENSDLPHEIVVVDDFSQDPEVDQFLKEQEAAGNITYYRYATGVPIHTVKNKGYLLSNPDTEYIHFSDNDVYYEPHWDSVMVRVLEEHPKLGIIGGQHHPNHQIDSTEVFGEGSLIYSNEQPGYSMFIRRKDFRTIGPWFSEKYAGGEDSNLCLMATTQGFLVAATTPAVVVHCGANSTTGRQAIDASHILGMAAFRKDIYVE